MEGDIRAGDLVICSTGDMRQAFPQFGRRSHIAKRFLGVNEDLGFLECDCTKPPRTTHIGLNNLKVAHRIVATARTEKEAQRLKRAMAGRTSA